VEKNRTKNMNLNMKKWKESKEIRKTEKRSKREEWEIKVVRKKDEGGRGLKEKDGRVKLEERNE